MPDQILPSYYAWCRQQAEQEVISGYRRLRHFKSLVAHAYVRYCETLSRERQLVLGYALIRLAQEADGDVRNLTNEEQQFISGWHTSWGGFIRQEAWKVSEAYLKNAVGRKEIRQAVVDNVGPFVGELKSRQGGVYCFTNVREHCVVRTYFDTASRTRALSYWHDVLPKDEGTVLIHHSSLCSWMGLSTSEWIGIERGEEELVIRTIHDLARTFMEAADRIATLDAM